MKKKGRLELFWAGLRSRLPRPSRAFWIVLLALLVLAAAAGWMLNPRLTAYLESPSFKAELDKQTSKGLHFSGAYSSIKRVGFATGYSPSFTASQGIKAFKTIQAEDITGTFNPWGIFLRRWQLDSIHIRSGQAEIQVYEPKPDHKPPKPWYAVFLPDRVYLKEVVCDSTNILWQQGRQQGGFYGVRLLITPYGRDFEYRGTGGVLVMPSVPELKLQNLHMTITKEWISLYEIHLAQGDSGMISAQGKAGLKGDKSVHAQAKFSDLPLAPWLPSTGGGKVRGTAAGDIQLETPDEKIEHSSGHGSLRLQAARLLDLPFLDYVASATRNKDLEHLQLSQCSFVFQWKYPKVEAREIRVEAKDEFRVEGAIAVDDGQIDGEVQFGVADRNLDWLPKAREQIFTRAADGYRWTKVRLGGTLKEPTNDLTPRLAETLKGSPAETTGLFFRTLGEWFQQHFKKD